MSIPAPVIPVPVAQFFDDQGHALVGGFLYSYLAGTTTPYPTYSDAALSQPNALNCPLDSSGRPTSGAIYLAPVTYKFDLQDTHGVSMRGYPRDNIADYGQLLGLSLSASSGSSLINFIQAGTGAVVRTVQDKLRERFSLADFGVAGIGGDDTAVFLLAFAAVAANGGGQLDLQHGATYHTTKRINLSFSNLLLNGHGATIRFTSGNPSVDDRAFAIAEIGTATFRTITGAIALGALTFTATAPSDTVDLVAGDWLVLQETDAGVANTAVFCDWVQVQSVNTGAGVVTTMNPFRMAFPGSHHAVQFHRVASLVNNVTFKDVNILSTDAVNALPCVTIGIGAKATVITGCTFQAIKGQAITTYLNNDLKVLGCHLWDGEVASEFASVTDLVVAGNTIGRTDITAFTSALSLDFGAGFFSVYGNQIVNAGNIAMQLVSGVHDGAIFGNIFGYVRDAGITNTQGISSLGTQCVQIFGNEFDGGDGASSTAIAFGNTTVLTPNIVSSDNKIGPNTIRGFVNVYSEPVSAADFYFDAKVGVGRFINAMSFGTPQTSPTLMNIGVTATGDETTLPIHFVKTGISNWFVGCSFEVAATPLFFVRFNLINSANLFKVTSTGSVVLGESQLGSTAVDGFLYLATSNGAPTGTPTAQTGTVAMTFDPNTSRLWIYNGGWKFVVVA